MLINFTWNANPPGDNVTTYHLYAGRASLTYNDPNSPKDTGNVTASSYDIGTTTGTWFFNLKAVNAQGEGPFAGEVSTTIQPPPPPSVHVPVRPMVGSS